MELREAEGYADLGMWQEAWEAIEELPAAERGQPTALRLRLSCCPHLGAWGIGEQIANLLRDGSESDRRMAAAFYLEHAREHPETAAHSINAAVATWPDCRLLILEDPLLGRVLFPGRH